MQFPFLVGKYVFEWSILRCYVSSLAGVYIKPSKKSTALENFLLEYAEHLTGVCILFSESKYCVEKTASKNKKKQPATVGIVLPSIHHLSTLEISTTIGPLKVWKFDKPNLSPFEGSGWWLGWWWWVWLRICQYYPWFCFFFVKRELEGRQEDFEIQHHLTNEIYLLRPSSKHSLCQNEWGVFCLT